MMVDDLLATARAPRVRLWSVCGVLHCSGPHKAIARLQKDLAANEAGLVSALAGAPNLGIIQDLKWLAERHEGPLAEIYTGLIMRQAQTAITPSQAKAMARAHVAGLICGMEGAPQSARH